jgi:hypothetical protein
MGSFTLSIQGIEVFIEGEAPDTVLMIHGWPARYSPFPPATPSWLSSRTRLI